MWLTAHTKESQWSVVTEVMGHPLATAGPDRGKVFRVRGHGDATCSVVCHMVYPSQMTVEGFESWAKPNLTAHHLRMDMIHSGYQFPLMRSACDLGDDTNRCHLVVQQCNKKGPLAVCLCWDKKWENSDQRYIYICFPVSPRMQIRGHTHKTDTYRVEVTPSRRDIGLSSVAERRC